MNKSAIIKVLFVVGLLISIAATYKMILVDGNYEVFVNEDGLPILDE